jgi:hypothetical protein
MAWLKGDFLPERTVGDRKSLLFLGSRHVTRAGRTPFSFQTGGYRDSWRAVVLLE